MKLVILHVLTLVVCVAYSEESEDDDTVRMVTVNDDHDDQDIKKELEAIDWDANNSTRLNRLESCALELGKCIVNFRGDLPVTTTTRGPSHKPNTPTSYSGKPFWGTSTKSKPTIPMGTKFCFKRFCRCVTR